MEVANDSNEPMTGEATTHPNQGVRLSLRVGLDG